MAEKTLFFQLVEIYPELTSSDFDPYFGTIELRDDADGNGAYISKWNYSQPIPKGYKLGK